ncbi:MAG: M20/M25/M40 family metallo-hydrolase [Gemmatimonadota bacterium]
MIHRRPGAAAPLHLALLLLAAGCGPSDEASLAPPDPSVIERADAERVLSILAADSMRGRRAFTDDALRAADFLAREFEQAGLEGLQGGYQQRFAVRSLEPGEAHVVLDGQALAPEQFRVRAGAPALAWVTGDVEVVRVDPADDLQSAMGRLRSVSGDALMLVPSARADLVAALAGFFERPVRTLGDAQQPSMVLAVWDGTDPTYEVTAAARITEEPLVNVVGMLPGRRSDEFVLFSAHYDHIGIRPAVEGDSIANGANDDASGTTAVVELARYFASRGTPERSLLFAAFTAEEGGGYGSRYYSSQLDPDQIVAMFNIEMIGKPAVEGPNTAWITGFERSSFGPLLQEAVQGTPYTFYADPYPEQNLFYRSDNATLARLGVPAHSISTTPIDVDTDYHQVSDEIETLDLDHLTNTIRAIATGAERFVTGESTPTRVDPATVERR